MSERSDETVEGGLLLELAATVALSAFSGVVAASLVRVFGDWGFLGDAVTIVAVGHGLGFLLRRSPLPSFVTVLTTLVVVSALAVRTVHPETFRALFPTGASWDAAAADFRFVGDEFAAAVTPVPFAGGWALLGLLAVAATVWLADAFAFSARGRGEALVPGAVLFVFVAALGTDRHAIALTVALVVAGVLAVAALRTNFAAAPRTTLGPHRHPLARAIPAAVVLAGIVGVSAWAVGPRLPGADDEPWIDTRGQGGGGVTEVVSPLVDIRSRLVEQSDAEMAVIAATEEANWRLSTLAQFDGTTWGLPQRTLRSASGDLNDPRPGSIANRQEIRIGALNGRLVPAAADPVTVEGEGLRFNADSSTLVRTDRPLAPGDAYVVESAMPRFEAAALQSATAADPPDPIYLELPRNFPDAVRRRAGEVTAGAATPYDRARALQDWFRNEFQYSLDVQPGHGLGAIEAFLERRVGYCEQFAGTMAAMARSVGLPARVAVGFTAGVRGADGAFRVTGRQAHAWPEIWFDGYGWVPFEPTPGRGAPGLEDVTGVAPAQDAPPPPAQTEPTPAPADPAVTTTTLGAGVDPNQSGATPDAPSAAPDAPATTGSRPPWRALALLVLVVALVVAAPALIRRLRRRHHATDTGQHVVDLWSRARRVVEVSTGQRLDPARTPLEQAGDVAPRLPVAAPPMRALAEVATAATYGPPGEAGELARAGAADGSGPDDWYREIEEVALDAMTPATRLRQYFTDWH